MLLESIISRMSFCSFDLWYNTEITIYLRYSEEIDFEELNQTLDKNPHLIFMLKDTKEGVQLQDKRIGFKTVKNCFTGKQLLDWLINRNFCVARINAIRVANALLYRGILDHITKNHFIEDADDVYYKFLQVK